MMIRDNEIVFPLWLVTIAIVAYAIFNLVLFIGILAICISVGRVLELTGIGFEFALFGMAVIIWFIAFILSVILLFWWYDQRLDDLYRELEKTKELEVAPTTDPLDE